MDQTTRPEGAVELSVENIGGISDTSVWFEPGVNVLSGRNATNRTSLLRSIMAALGSDDVSLKSDADEGSVELRIGDETYTRRLVREDGTVRMEGDPYLDDPELADLFAFLLATNETRRAVLTGGDLRAPLMRPVDTTAIRSEIDSLVEERDRIDGELDDLSDLPGTLADLENERRTLNDRIEETETELETKREEIEDANARVDESRERKRELDERMSELGDVRSELDGVRQELRAQRQSLDSLRDEREELVGEAETLPETPEGMIEEIDAEIDRLRDRRQAVQSEVNTLQRIIQFNEDNLDGTSSEILEALGGGDGTGAVTDELLDDSETVVCWTCGHEVDRADIEGTLDRLRDLRRSKLGESRELDDRIDDLEDERATHEEEHQRRQQVQRRLRRTRERIESREERIEELESRRDSLEAEMSGIEASVDDLQTRKDSTVLSLHREANQLEVELNRLEEERGELAERIERVESELDRREELDERRERIAERLADLRTRIDRIEAEAVESFNQHMDTVLEVLEYDNLARIWIERTGAENGTDRRNESEREFTLHVVRESEDDRAYEDSIRHLSESEREVTGLVFALAGFLVHDVHEEVPFVLLDSLEAIDAGRIAKLLEYFGDHPEYLLVALLPEDAAAVSEEYAIIREF